MASITIREAHIFTKRANIGGKPVKSKWWRGRYKLPGDLKCIDVSLKTADKEVAASKLRKIVSEAERECEGFIAPRIIFGTRCHGLAESRNGARCRVRTCDFLRVKQALYH